MDDWYDIGAWLTGVIVFIVIWWYCAATYGFIGFALGWMPALIMAGILGFLWPLLALLLIVIVLFIVVMMSK